MRAEPVSGARLGAGPAPNHLLGGARREVPPPLRASDGGGVRGSGAWVPCGVRPHISRLLGCWPPSSVLASCSPFRVRNSVFPSPPGGPRDLEGIAPLTAFRVTPRPSSGRRARAGARPLSPAPRSRPSSRCPGGRRPLAPLLLSPPGRESAAHRPGTRRGAGAAPNRPRITSAPLSRFPESLFPLHSPQPLGEPRRDEVRVGGGEGGDTREGMCGAGGRGAGVPVCTTRRGPAGRESLDHVLFVPRRRREVPGPGRPSVGWTGGQGPHGRPERPGGGGLCVKPAGRVMCRWPEAPPFWSLGLTPAGTSPCTPLRLYTHRPNPVPLP